MTGTRKSASWGTITLLSATAVFVYLQVFALPAIPLIDTGGDQPIYLFNAIRLLQGQVMYRDFFEFTAPGAETVYCALFKLLGVRAWVPEASLVLLGVCLAWLSLVIARKLLGGAAMFLPALLFLTFPYQYNLDATHHWFSTLFVTAALAILIENRSAQRVLAAGVCCGVALWFTQSRGLVALLGLAVFLIWESHRKKQPWRSLLRLELCLLGSFVATVLVSNSYFAWKAGLKQFLYCTISFGLKYYPSESSNNWRVYGLSVPSYHFWYRSPDLFIWLSIHILTPLIYILFFVRAWREAPKNPSQPWDRLMLVNVVGLSLFLGIAPAPSYARLCTVSLPALILLVWFAKWPGRFERVVYGLLWFVVLALGVYETVSIQDVRWKTLDLPTGHVALYEPDYSSCRWLATHVKPSDYLFGESFMNYALLLRNPAPIDFVTSTDYTRPEQVQAVIESLERTRTRWVVIWYLFLDVPGPGNHLAPLHAYLLSHYHVDARTLYNYEEVWERNGQHPDALPPEQPREHYVRSSREVQTPP